MGDSGLVPAAPPIHGADRHDNVTREIFLEASGGHIVAGLTYDLEKGSAVKGIADAVEPDVYFSMTVPPDFVSFQTIKAIWSPDSPGNMYWRLLASWAANGEVKTAHLETTDYGVSAGINLKVQFSEHPDPLLLTGLAVGDWLGIRFLRLGNDPLDTIDDLVRFAGLLFIYTANQ